MPRGSQFPRIRGVSRARRRSVGWEEGPFGVQGPFTVPTSAVFGTAQTATADSLTIVRMRGEFIAQLLAPTTDGFRRCAFGICVVSENAAGVGISAIPTPVTDVAWDGWFVHRMFALIGESASPVVTELRYEIDSKAMRKLDESDVVVGVVEVTDEEGTASLKCVLNTRMLIKAPA